MTSTSFFDIGFAPPPVVPVLSSSSSSPSLPLPHLLPSFLFPSSSSSSSSSSICLAFSSTSLGAASAVVPHRVIYIAMLDDSDCVHRVLSTPKNIRRMTHPSVLAFSRPPRLIISIIGEFDDVSKHEKLKTVL